MRIWYPVLILKRWLLRAPTIGKTHNDHVKYKARLVAHGYRQVYGTDYWETYAPVSSSRAIRALLTLAASHKMIIHQMDVDTAFLNATLQEEIYMIPPAGLTGTQPGQVLKLNKSLYGLKQSPRNFNLEINDTLGVLLIHVYTLKL